ncbi:MAG: heme-binding domain-containing protein [Gemmatimonadaceae bacterium]
MSRLQSFLLLVLLAIFARSLAAQGPVPGTPANGPATPPAMPVALAPSGAVTHDPVYEKKIQTEVKALDGFKVTLFAEPPFAEYPTCVTATLEGVVFVCTDPNLAQDYVKGRGRIIRLVDADGVGHADRYTVFTDVDSPRGMIWDGKALYVLHPPNLSAYYDDNGDGIADRAVDLVKGISAASLDTRAADHSTNGITLGIDGWIYIAVGDYGFVKAVGRDGTQVGHHGGGVARVRPDGSGLEMYTTGTRNMYDLGVDPFLHVFSRDNTNDGGGWDTRMHYLAPGADMGYPSLFRNFASEHMPSIFDYGPGAGTGGLWVQDAGFPTDANDMFYSGDWTMNRIYRHPMTRKGASFVPKQEEFLTITRPSDMAMDGRSNMYVASLSGGQFKFVGDTVGFIARVSFTGKPASAAPRIAGASETELLSALGSPNAEHRLHAQRELLRRGRSPSVTRGLEAQLFDAKRSPETRVAALFTLEQLDGTAARASLLRAAQVPALRASAFRALTNRREETMGLSPSVFVAGLSDADPDVRVQAITSLVRLGATGSADAIARLLGSDDPVIAHLATQALVSLDARDAALRVLDGGPPAARTHALYALERMHDPQTVSALITRAGAARNAAARRPLLAALARLYNVEGTWLGDWWTTHPSTVGPYYAPQGWTESARIRPVLTSALLAANEAEFKALADDLSLNGVLPSGAGPLLAALTATHDPRRDVIIRSFTGSRDLDDDLVATLVQLDRQNAQLHAGVAELVSAQSALPPNAVPLLRRAALDSTLSGTVRSTALVAISRLPERAGFDAAVEAFSRVNPVPGSNPDVEQAWRRYVGDRSRFQNFDDFIALTHDADPQKRVLAYAVLVQLNRAAGRRPAGVVQAGGAAGGPFAVMRQKLVTTIDESWTDPARAASLARAIRIMRLDADYAEQLKAHPAGE